MMKHKFMLTLSDGVTSYRHYLLRSRTRSGWRHEHERSTLSLSHQHDFPECFRCYQCELCGFENFESSIGESKNSTSHDPNFFLDSLTGFLSWTADIHTRITRSTLPDQHLLFGENPCRNSTVLGGSHDLHVDRLSDDWSSRGLPLLLHCRFCCDTRRQCRNVFRLFNIMRKFIDFHGFEYRSTRHHSILDFWRVFPQLGFCAGLFQMAFIFVLVPLRKWSFDHQSMGWRDWNYLYSFQHDVPSQWKSHLRDTQLQPGENLKAAVKWHNIDDTIFSG